MQNVFFFSSNSYSSYNFDSVVRFAAWIDCISRAKINHFFIILNKYHQSISITKETLRVTRTVTTISSIFSFFVSLLKLYNLVY